MTGGSSVTWKGLRVPSVQCISRESVVKLTMPVGNERRAWLQTCLACISSALMPHGTAIWPSSNPNLFSSHEGPSPPMAAVTRHDADSVSRLWIQLLMHQSDRCRAVGSKADQKKFPSRLPLVLPARQAAWKEMAVKLKRCHFQQLGCSSGATDSMQVNASSRAATAGEGGNGLQASMSHCSHARLAESSGRVLWRLTRELNQMDTTFRVQP